ncbi:MAG: class I SAM-dependent methyltransferase [Candidatus Eisenbacteria bacterium]|uniref:Class I SAM-dependent methyltransferase n=1 Tax=Eiseniibacteriota bacterium TaxID=2212470 RepID=A0A948S2J2_UNCEI|nr:class I SAM-dependent methyltransferase [Candidatus Eisenbacteria bacterium]MBU1948682.1 class I SAM-dependent methyltransferase [Candidatus Eisenbacteria bacterium]MBU2692659.1 class I SAM-dependent methyltransferase [Candidatus Eisenbacteria bacterium]
MKPWHEDDSFWKDVEDVLFPERRREIAAGEIENVIARLDLKPGSHILDLCCGVGRHSIELAKRGFRVTAVDRTKKYLDAARERASKEGLGIEFVHEDMREFMRANAYDAAINMYTSFGYFRDPADDEKVLGNLYRSIRPGGRLLMDLMGKEILARMFKERDWYEGDGFIILEEREVKESWSWIENRWIILRDGERKDLHLSHRLYSAAELQGLMKSAGFRTTEAFGDLEGGPYNHQAKRLVVVAKK